MIALGLSACPKEARDLTFQCFVGNMHADWYGCFLLSEGIREGPAGMYEIPGDWRRAFSLRPHLKIRPVVGRSETVVVASGEKCLLSSPKWSWRHLKRQGIIRSREKMASRGPSRGIIHVSTGDQNSKGWACVGLGYCCLMLEVIFLERFDIFFYLSRLSYILATFLSEEHTRFSLFCSEQV
jgi:hypothetical protein